MSDNCDNMIAIKREDAIPVLQAFCDAWEQGGRERSKIALEQQYKSEALAQMADYTTGFLWWKRKLYRHERERRLEEEWEDVSWNNFSPAGDAHLTARWKQHNRETYYTETAALLRGAKQAPAGAMLYIKVSDWNYAHRSF